MYIRSQKGGNSSYAKFCFTSGVAFSLRGDSISNTGDGHVLITDINPNALICRSEIPLSNIRSRRGDWYLHPTQMSTDEADRIKKIPQIGTLIEDGLGTDTMIQKAIE